MTNWGAVPADATLPASAWDDAARASGSLAHSPTGAYRFANGEEMASFNFTPVSDLDGFFTMLWAGAGSYYLDRTTTQAQVELHVYRPDGSLDANPIIQRIQVPTTASHQSWSLVGMATLHTYVAGTWTAKLRIYMTDSGAGVQTDQFDRWFIGGVQL